jgi:hypothetical protein
MTQLATLVPGAFAPARDISNRKSALARRLTDANVRLEAGFAAYFIPDIAPGRTREAFRE